MIRARVVLSRIYRCQGLDLKAFQVLRQCLHNFKDYSLGKRRVEKAEETKTEFDVPQQFGGGSGAPAAGGGKPGKGKDDKKGKGKGKEAPKEAAEEEPTGPDPEEEREVERTANNPKREHPAPYLWCLTKYLFIELIYQQH